MKVAFISCTKLKADYPCVAREMYLKSTLFSKAMKYIEQKDYDDWFVLSAKYGLLIKDEVIEPYDSTLNNMRVSARRKWAVTVLQQFEELELPIKKIDFYAGAKYREFLIPLLTKGG